MTDAFTPDCLLTLALPQSLEEELLDTLMTLSDRVPGFTLQHGHGLGRHIELASAMEQVQGRARRSIVQVAMQHSHVSGLLDRLRATMPSPQIAYWVTPLLAFGRLGASA